MIQICQKDKEKVFEAIRTGKIDAAEMSFPNLIDDILLVMKKGDLQLLSHRPCRINAGITAISLLTSSCALPLLPSSNARPALRMSPLQ